MKKDYSRDKLLEFDENKVIKVLYDLAISIEKNPDSSGLLKLKKYHEFLKDSPFGYVQKINKEFAKVSDTNRHFQIYIMLLERFLGQTSKEYHFLVRQGDSESSSKKFPIICLLDSVRSAHNVGAFFRNAECFGVKKLYLCGLTPQSDHPQVIKTAMGCQDHVDSEYVESAVEVVHKYKDLGYKIYGIETTTDAKDVNELKSPPEKSLLIFGHEQFGVSLELLQLADHSLKIQLYGKKNSLNVGVSQGIILNQFISQISLPS